MKNLIFTLLLLCSTSFSFAQNIPAYVPTNGLVGWWPFNGNANDESGNGNNGSFTGLSCVGCGNVTAAPTATSDRFNINNAAYQFSDSFDLINIPNSSSLQVSNQFTISVWANPNLGSYGQGPNYFTMLQKWGTTGAGASYMVALTPNGIPILYTNNGINNTFLEGLNPIPLNDWTSITFSFQNGIANLYINGIFSNADSNLVNPAVRNSDIEIARNLGSFVNSTNETFAGKLDDIGIWSRALTPQEISDLYNAVNCANNLSINPTQNSVQRGNTATFTATTSDPNPTVIWQSDLGQGFQTLNNFGNYSGTNTATLNIANVQLSEHNQPVRAISTSGNCVDTSAVSVINVLDTCVTTVFDTITTFISVTDTLIINAVISSVNPPNNVNTLLIYPNPANTHITIDNGNFATMAGYSVRINNALGQLVFNQNITQQQFFIDLSGWTGPGLYYVNILDPNGNPIEVKKIVIQ
jgi:hypothetical protein